MLVCSRNKLTTQQESKRDKKQQKADKKPNKNKIQNQKTIPSGRPWTSSTYVSTHPSTHMYKISVHIYQTSSLRDSSPKNHVGMIKKMPT